jgi:ABC-type Na+ efflux pump permease subunit
MKYADLVGGLTLAAFAVAIAGAGVGLGYGVATGRVATDVRVTGTIDVGLALWGLLAIGGLLLTAAAIEVYGSDDVQTAQDIVDDARGSASDDDE